MGIIAIGWNGLGDLVEVLAATESGEVSHPHAAAV
jgi:hypothetical protein